ncbi:hypothetical protein QAD02_005634 [Eretmocerus hayati]|uniref:Uncharacterized protein n=1 Tax=Eretmocerus hayati TaxID=131215 RepID=A0ACC2NTH3_9HYME|nr:hypothetical protein QAD02_005634 [Eretmocerus hayati]
MESLGELTSCIESKDWDSLITILKPKEFCSEVPRTLEDFAKLVKVAELLTDTNIDLSDKVKNVLLKCLANSCVNGYLEKAYTTEDSSAQNNLYRILAAEVPQWDENSSYPYRTHFPYDDVVRWVTKTVTEYGSGKGRMAEDQSEVLRLSIQFLCNFFTFAFDISTSTNADGIMEYIKEEHFKKTIIKLVGHDRAPIARATCAYIHNMVKQVFKEFYASIDKKELTAELIKSTMSDIQAALDTVILLLKDSSYLKDIYDEISIDDRLYLLDIIHEEIRAVAYDEENKNDSWLPVESIEFLTDKFKKKSDLILKTSDSQMNNIEPTEVTILLKILGVMTSNPNLEACKKLREDKSLLISCIYLLKAVHMVGKESNNSFTPLQKLSDLTLSNETNGACNANNHVKNIQSHPAFGFKAGLIRIIGNLSHNHEKNQNLVRETDGIPLLLDCCNIDARNPLIIQWTTLAVRNLVENNLENQEVIRRSVKIGVVDSALMRELGLTLHDEGEGNAIGIMPLPK